jgi:flagellar secretion chaperone FliS
MISNRRGRDPYRAIASNYRGPEVLSASSVELTVLLYEQLVADLRGAAIALRSGQIEAKSTNIQRATDILFELLGSLDHARGGEVSQRLETWYQFMVNAIAGFSRRLDPDGLDQLAVLVDELLEAWRSVSPAAAISREEF